MTNEASTSTIDDLDALLEAERKSLLSGDLVALTQMLPIKEALIEALNKRADGALTRLEQLDGKVRRNQLLLDGALEGIRDVANRLAALRRARHSLETYGSDGVRKDIEVSAVPSVERRA